MADDASWLLGFLTLHSLPTCLLPTLSRKNCGRSLSHRRIWFLAWSPRCAGRHASGKWTRCLTAEALQSVEELLLHSVDQSCSPRPIHSSHWGLPSLWAPRSTCPVLQAPSGPTWEGVRFSDMGGDCSDPTPGWPPSPSKDPQIPGQHRIGHLTLPTAQNLRDQGPSS